MKLAIAQINTTVGDLAGNAARIADSARRARAAGATLLLTPELALCGYPPEDLLLRDDFYQACDRALRDLAAAVPGITLVVGHPAARDGAHYNAASVLCDGAVLASYFKHKLPNYSVFDEMRYFSCGTHPLVFTHAGFKIGLLICADVWEPAPALQARDAGADLLLALNASPYHLEKQQTRYEVVRERVRQTGLPLVYANLVGGQDELVFEGASFVMDAGGQVTQELPACEQALGLVTFDNAGHPLADGSQRQASPEAAVYQVLCLGVRDYIEKNGFPGALLGLSGGIDSALTLAIAVDALGADRVRTVMMPSEFTADISLSDAAEMAGILGVHHSVIPIGSLFDSFTHALAGEFAGRPFDLAEENLQARIRGTLLMALSNKFGDIVLTTGNKSEMSVGYSTLYGDMAGGFAVLKDVPKTLVYRLAEYRNALSPVIPRRIITRAPSAELRHDQTDQDSLPAYEILDAIMQAYVEDDLSPAAIIALGYRREDVQRVVTLIDRNEYKRRQSPVGVRITQRGFGKDRRYPITSKYRFAF